MEWSEWNLATCHRHIRADTYIYGLKDLHTDMDTHVDTYTQTYFDPIMDGYTEGQRA